MPTQRIIHGDSLTVLPTLPAWSIDAVVCDPPYELGFSGRPAFAEGWRRSDGFVRPQSPPHGKALVGYGVVHPAGHAAGRYRPRSVRWVGLHRHRCGP